MSVGLAETRIGINIGLPLPAWQEWVEADMQERHYSYWWTVVTVVDLDFSPMWTVVTVVDKESSHLWTPVTVVDCSVQKWL